MWERLPSKDRQSASESGILSRLPPARKRSALVEAPSLRSSACGDFETYDSPGHFHRLGILREQLLRENRRSAGPFSHPLAAHGPLWRLREQIRDVSRIADAIVASAEQASEARTNELCSDLRRLLQTQQSWTERLENQIWRLESQARLMKRLQQVLLHGSPGTDQLWQLCELIARETQAVPDGFLLLPEPGQRIALPAEGGLSFAAMSIEQARLGVYAAISLLPDVRGAEIVVGTLQASARRVAEGPSAVDLDAVSSEIRAIADIILRLTATRSPADESQHLINVVQDFSANLEQVSLTVEEQIVPPGIRQYYHVISERWPSQFSPDGQQSAKSFCGALGIAAQSPNSRHHTADAGDERIVLSHKLRWHDGDTARSAVSSKQESQLRIRRPNLFGAAADQPRFSVFTE